MKYFSQLCVSNPWTREVIREAAVVEASSEGEAAHLFGEILVQRIGYTRYNHGTVSLEGYENASSFAVVQKKLFSEKMVSDVGFAVRIGNGTVGEMEHYLLHEWDGMGSGSKSHLSVWDFIPEQNAHMRDDGRVFAHLFETSGNGAVRFVKTIQLARK